MILSVLAASLVWAVPDNHETCHGDWGCVFHRLFLLFEGGVNFILSAIPIIIGCVCGKKKSLDLILFILFTVFAGPNSVLLLLFNCRFVQDFPGGPLFGAVGIVLGLLYIIEIILCWAIDRRWSVSGGNIIW